MRVVTIAMSVLPLAPSCCGRRHDCDRDENEACRFRDRRLGETCAGASSKRLAEVSAPGGVVSRRPSRFSPDDIIGRIDHTVVVEVARQSEQELRWAERRVRKSNL